MVNTITMTSVIPQTSQSNYALALREWDASVEALRDLDSLAASWRFRAMVRAAGAVAAAAVAADRGEP